MKRALLIAGGLMLVSAPLHAYVSGGTMLGRNLGHRSQQASAPATTQEAEATDPLSTDPTVGVIDVRDHREVQHSEPGHPVPEPGTMAITSMGLLAAAAFRKKRSTKQS